jgi:glutathione S-transferase
MDVSSALNRIEVVLNQYNAFKEVKEALEAAVGAEQLVVELGLRAEALRAEIAELEVELARNKSDIASELEDAKDKYKIILDGLAADEDALKAAISSDKKVLADLKQKIKGQKEADSKYLVAAEREIADMKAAVAVEVARFEAAQKAIAELREKI